MAITSEKKLVGKSNIRPPGDRADNEGQTAFQEYSAPPAYPQARRRPLLQHLAAESEQRGGPPAGLCRHHAGRFDKGAGLDQPAEILLVQVTPRDRLDGPLQFSECELGGQKF